MLLASLSIFLVTDAVELGKQLLILLRVFSSCVNYIVQILEFKSILFS